MSTEILASIDNDSIANAYHDRGVPNTYEHDLDRQLRAWEIDIQDVGINAMEARLDELVEHEVEGTNLPQRRCAFCNDAVPRGEGPRVPYKRELSNGLTVDRAAALCKSCYASMQIHVLGERRKSNDIRHDATQGREVERDRDERRGSGGLYDEALRVAQSCAHEALEVSLG